MSHLISLNIQQKENKIANKNLKRKNFIKALINFSRANFDFHVRQLLTISWLQFISWLHISLFTSFEFHLPFRTCSSYMYNSISLEYPSYHRNGKFWESRNILICRDNYYQPSYLNCCLKLFNLSIVLLFPFLSFV